MAERSIFTGWDKRCTALWGNEPVFIGHNLHVSPLFSREGLAALIENYPRERYNIFHMGAKSGDGWFWRQGDISGMTGEEVIEAVSKGRLWLNLRNVNLVDPRYGKLLDDLLGELSGYMPGFLTRRRGSGILISSPNAQVYYHVDLPGQLLFQISGRKRVYFYPAHPPFITHEHLERTAVTGLGVDIPFAPWYDEYARIQDFEPGQMVHWPHFAPHRVENHDCLNVSMTVDFSTEPILRAQIVNYANGILRCGFGVNPRSRSISGLSFWAKALLQKTLRDTAWMKKKKAAHAQIEFRLDRAVPGGIVNLATPAAEGDRVMAHAEG
ncbi:MAG: hypothetical protein JO273_24635 [Methylobacteriaceae bacterium]|nr:hypothetical protein [Methylobacteriaceae bacterium]